MSEVTAEEVVTVLEGEGVVFTLDSAGELVIRSPRGLLTPDLRAAIQVFKPAIVAIVQGRRRVFDGAAGPRWRQAWERARAMPHVALEAAIDASDLAAFDRELAVYVAATAPVERESAA